MRPLPDNPTWRTWSFLISLAILLTRLNLPAAEASPTQTPTQTIKHTIGELLRVLDDEGLKAPGRAEDRRSAIEQVVRSRVSYEEMAKRALGTLWTSLTLQERQEFVDLFVQLLRDAFAGRITDYSGEQVVYLDEQFGESLAEVRTRLVGRKTDTEVDFRVVEAGGEWLVFDVVIDGASIVSNYRAQFTKVMKEASYPGLVSQMRQRSLTIKRFEISPPQ